MSEAAAEVQGDMPTSQQGVNNAEENAFEEIEEEEEEVEEEDAGIKVVINMDAAALVASSRPAFGNTPNKLVRDVAAVAPAVTSGSNSGLTASTTGIPSAQPHTHAHMLGAARPLGALATEDGCGLQQHQQQQQQQSASGEPVLSVAAVNAQIAADPFKPVGVQMSKWQFVDGSQPQFNVPGVMELELQDLEDKPWRKPGADLTEYFNYGFNEDTWRAYCQRQKQMREQRTMQAKIRIMDSQDDARPARLGPGGPALGPALGGPSAMPGGMMHLGGPMPMGGMGPPAGMGGFPQQPPVAQGPMGQPPFFGQVQARPGPGQGPSFGMGSSMPAYGAPQFRGPAQAPIPPPPSASAASEPSTSSSGHSSSDRSGSSSSRSSSSSSGSSSDRHRSSSSSSSRSSRHRSDRSRSRSRSRSHSRSRSRSRERRHREREERSSGSSKSSRR